MNTGTLGRLEKVDLRECWQTEAGDFTPWLAEEQNIELLGEAIGIELEVEGQEKSVGPFRADILCKNTADAHWVLIENQLGRTDHTHLGQLMTYAAGLNAVTIVWIAATFTEEHRAALDWLNEITDERFNFFGIVVELWKIGDSLAAPRFSVVSKPNDWSRAVAGAVHKIEVTPASARQAMQLEFWTQFREYMQVNGSSVRATKPLPQNWMWMAIGRTGFGLVGSISAWSFESQTYGDQFRLRADLVIADSQAGEYFALLQKQQTEIEADFGEPLNWYEQDNVKNRRIYMERIADFEARDTWPELFEWLRTTLERLRNVFRDRVRALDLAAAEDEPPSTGEQ